ncbi:hypothetical protein LTS12_008857 [Elasticomyces elasticus]|nr:hypothetical protein LTS12_008857 [Elasticomyces elasticus]
MASKFLRSVSERVFTPSGTPTATIERKDGFHTAKTLDAQLFTKTVPEIDGEDCLHDCTTCTIHYPRKFEIEEDDNFYGHINGFSRHLIIATGKTDWVRDVEDEKGSVMEAVGKNRGCYDEGVGGGNLMLSASNIPTESDFLGEGDGKGNYGRPTRVLLLPAFQWINGVTTESVPDLIKGVVNRTPTVTTQLLPPSQTNSHSIPDLQLPEGLTLSSCPHKYLILLCSQATRDARCGQSAPLLRRELERHLRPLGLFRDLGDERPGGVGIYFISHVGGHKYSANMLVYRKADHVPVTKAEANWNGASNGNSATNGDGGSNGHGTGSDEVEEAAQCIWLARIKPEDCENIVRYTVLQGKVVKPESQLRGGFDRGKGVGRVRVE